VSIYRSRHFIATASRRAVAILFATTLAFALVLAALQFAPTTAWAANTNVALSTHEVNLAADQQDFQIAVTVSNPNAFAGAEFGIQGTDELSLNSVSYSASKGTAGPVKADGLTWFSFFSGANDFSGAVTATLNLSYSGTENTLLVLDNVQLYTKTADSVQRETLNLRKTVAINRAGATNEPPPLEAPKRPEPGVSGNNEGGGGTRTINGGDSSSSGAGGNNNSGGGGAGLSPLPLASDNTDSATSGADPIGNLASDPSTKLSDLAAQAAPLAAGLADNSIQDSNDLLAILLSNPLFWLFVAFFAGVIVVLGYLLIKNRKKPRPQSAE
jgi:uncharacterized membrane protein YgcG